MQKQKIPKVIHYCWFGGGKMSEREEKCIESWRKCCPDYTIQCWNETNFDFSDCRYAVEAAKAQKWSFVTDYVRLKVLYDYGGFYFDTDVEMLKNLEPLREHGFFIGFETNERVNDGQGFGAIAKHPIVGKMLAMYQELSFFTEEGRYNLKESPQYRTEVLLENGLQLTGKRQQLGDAQIYPVDYFCPKSFQTGRIRVTENTYSIHHFRGSWHTQKEQRYIRIAQGMNRLIGERAGRKFLRWMYACNDFFKHKKQQVKK